MMRSAASKSAPRYVPPSSSTTVRDPGLEAGRFRILSRTDLATIIYDPSAPMGRGTIGPAYTAPIIAMTVAKDLCALPVDWVARIFAAKTSEDLEALGAELATVKASPDVLEALRVEYREWIQWHDRLRREAAAKVRPIRGAA